VASTKIEWSGLKELQYALNTAPRSLDPLFTQALNEEAQVIFARSQLLVPVATGALKGSGYVNPPKTEGKITYSEIGYGGPASSYAMWVHESYSKHRRPTQRKFLERPVNERSRYLQKNIAIRMNDMLRRLWTGGSV